MCMTILDRVIEQQLNAYGIKTPDCSSKTNGRKISTCNKRKVKVFRAPLEILLQCHTDHGDVPRFLVVACTMLLEHTDQEGLFRKTGSITRQKALRVQLDAGKEECLSTANPHIVAGLVKQFFRELPEPILPTELHDAFLKAQALTSEADRTAATLLLSCKLPDRNNSVLSYLFDFLHSVSKRSAENKMDSNNLSVVLTPNLLPPGEGTENMETNLKLQRAVIQCFIENAQDFGVLPQCLVKEVESSVRPASETSDPLSPQDREENTIGKRAARAKKNIKRFGTWIRRTFGCNHRGYYVFPQD